MIQLKRMAEGKVPVVMMTHQTCEADIRQALKQIELDGEICEPSVLIRIENNNRI